MRYFMKFYPDCTIGIVEQVDDSMTLLSGNDEKGVFNWIEVFDKQQLATARREGWEHGKKQADSLLLDLVDVVLESKPVVQSTRRAIAAMEYGGEK